MRRRAAVEPVIGHLKDERRNHLKGRDGDCINTVLAAAGYNFSLLLRWFEELLRVLLLIIYRSVRRDSCLASLALGNILHRRLHFAGPGATCRLRIGQGRRELSKMHHRRVNFSIS